MVSDVQYPDSDTDGPKPPLRLRLDRLGSTGIGVDPILRWKLTHTGVPHTWMQKIAFG